MTTTAPRQADRELDETVDAYRRCLQPGVLTESESERAERLRERIVDLATRRLPVSVTIAAGTVRRVSAQTAYNDHDVELDAGTYDLDWDRDGRSLYAPIPATELPWWNVTAGFAGVAYAGEQRGGERTTYYLDVYPYQAREGGYWNSPTITFNY